MTIRNLEHVFEPRAVALIGASATPGKLGRVVLTNLLKAGFKGEIYPVNPGYAEIGGRKCYPDVASLPVPPDLAVIATPAETVPGLIHELGKAGAKAAIILSAGLGRGPGSLAQAALDAARPHLLRLVGPNSLGLMAPRIGLDASFSHTSPEKGDLAFLSQSGAVITTVADWATAHNTGFSAMVSLGDMADIDFGDLLDWFAADTATRAILLYVEAITHPQKFMSAARSAARAKPVVVIKAGRHAEAAKAAASHTGALAGVDAVYDAAFRRAGLLRVFQLEELFAATETLSRLKPFRGDKLAVLTNGGGTGVLAVDTLADHGGKLAELDEETLRALDGVLPGIWPRNNPVDILGDADTERYRASLDLLLADKNTDAVLVMNCPSALASSKEAAEATAEAIAAYKEKRPRGKPVFTAWLGGATGAEARQIFEPLRIPSYETPEDAVRGFMYLTRYSAAQDALIRMPPRLPENFKPDAEAARRTISAALAAGKEWLSTPEIAEIFSAYDIPFSDAHFTNKPESTAEVPAVHRPGARELVLGLVDDPLFGPAVLFGQGGMAAEIIEDKALALPPLDLVLAHDLIGQTRVANLLKAYRTEPAADTQAIALTLVKLSQLAADLPEVRDLEINPLLADQHGVLALDARLRVAPEPRRDRHGGNPRFAVHPYPSEWVREMKLEDGTTIEVRPVRPEDEILYHEFFDNVTPEDARLRFFSPKPQLSHKLITRFTQIDYNRAMAFVALEKETGQLWGVVRLHTDPDGIEAEYAILIRSDLKGKGLGWALMQLALDYGRMTGLKKIYGDVLRTNSGMLRMCAALGFAQHQDLDDPGIVRVDIDL